MCKPDITMTGAQTQSSFPQPLICTQWKQHRILNAHRLIAKEQILRQELNRILRLLLANLIASTAQADSSQHRTSSLIQSPFQAASVSPAVRVGTT